MLDTAKFYIVGNNLSLDFVNTLAANSAGPVDLIESVDDLLGWAARAELIDPVVAEELKPEWQVDGEEIVARAKGFRESLHKMYDDLSENGTVSDLELQKLNRVLARQNGTVEVVRVDDHFEKRFLSDPSDPDQLFASVSDSAADLLCYSNPELIKKCENEPCVLLFLDTTKNHSRIWCSMANCGNRAKAAAFYQRKKAKRST
jgi:predicted RNA-binding Zn ribbon-like protein